MPNPQAVIAALQRKAGQVTSDPVLRRWLWRRLTGREPGPAPFTPHKPPYLSEHGPFDVSGAAFRTQGPATDTPNASKDGPVDVHLAGLPEALNTAAPLALFQAERVDLEHTLAAHRFAWLPLLDEPLPPAALTKVWQAWWDSYGSARDGWEWNAYTAAERAANLIDYVHRFSWAGDTTLLAGQLASHADTILARLEYAGEEATSNHLANNGRGLYRLGCDLGLDEPAAIGFQILDAEAGRIFLPSGVLREASYHYHLLYLRNYADCWLAAMRADRPATECDRLAGIVKAAAGAAKTLTIAGDPPLIGDLSPDSPPAHVIGLERMAGGYADSLAHADHAALSALINEAAPAPPEKLAEDGWIVHQSGPWQAVFPAAPEGWPPVAGHGHQDFGAPVVSMGGTPLFIDPGRGSYGADGDAARYRSAAVHGLFVLGDAPPFPENKPYYRDTFRQRITGAPPAVTSARGEVTLSHNGYRRFNWGEAVSRWLFDDAALEVRDTAPEAPAHVSRRRTFITPWPVALEGENGATIETSAGPFHLSVSGTALISINAITAWQGYGLSSRATRIDVREKEGGGAPLVCKFTPPPS